MTPEEQRDEPAVKFEPQVVVGEVLRKVDNPDQLPPRLNRKQRRALQRKHRKERS
jgi:hypothetical protein